MSGGWCINGGANVQLTTHKFPIRLSSYVMNLSNLLIARKLLKEIQY
jgi:hypothetical protein